MAVLTLARRRAALTARNPRQIATLSNGGDAWMALKGAGAPFLGARAMAPGFDAGLTAGFSEPGLAGGDDPLFCSKAPRHLRPSAVISKAS